MIQLVKLLRLRLNNNYNITPNISGQQMSKNSTIDTSMLQRQRQKNKVIHNNLTKEEQGQLNQMFDESQLQNYFLAAQGKMPYETIELAGVLYAEEGQKNVLRSIKLGALQINDQPENLDKDFLKQKISIEQEKTLNLKLKKAQIEHKLKYLQIQTSPYLNLKSSRVNPEFNDEYRPPNVLSKEQHEQYMQKVMKSREQADRKQKHIIEKLEQGIKQQQQKLKQLQSQKINKEKEKRRKQIEKNLLTKKQEHKKALEEQIKQNQEYKKVKNKQFLHEKIEAKFQTEVLLPALEEKKKKLKQIREMSRAFDIQDLLKHEKQYVEKRNQSFSTVKSKVTEDWNYKPPEKKQRLAQMLEEEKLQQRKMLEQKKRKIEQKIQRQVNFVEYLKERFIPKIDEEKQKQIQMRVSSIKKPKRREAPIDSRTIGISYLQQAKMLKKQSPQRPQTEKQLSLNLEKTSEKGQTDYLSVNRKQKQYYQQKRRKRLQNLIISQKSSQEKINSLKQESQKINEAYTRKYELAKLKKEDINDQDDALELLLSGIKAKMGIISIYKNKQQTI